MGPAELPYPPATPTSLTGGEGQAFCSARGKISLWREVDLCPMVGRASCWRFWLLLICVKMSLTCGQCGVRLWSWSPGVGSADT